MARPTVKSQFLSRYTPPAGGEQSFAPYSQQGSGRVADWVASKKPAISRAAPAASHAGPLSIAGPRQQLGLPFYPREQKAIPLRGIYDSQKSAISMPGPPNHDVAPSGGPKGLPSPGSPKALPFYPQEKPPVPLRGVYDSQKPAISMGGPTLGETVGNAAGKASEAYGAARGAAAAAQTPFAARAAQFAGNAWNAVKGAPGNAKAAIGAGAATLGQYVPGFVKSIAKPVIGAAAKAAPYMPHAALGYSLYAAGDPENSFRGWAGLPPTERSTNFPNLPRVPVATDIADGLVNSAKTLGDAAAHPVEFGNNFAAGLGRIGDALAGRPDRVVRAEQQQQSSQMPKSSGATPQALPRLGDLGDAREFMSHLNDGTLSQHLGDSTPLRATPLAPKIGSSASPSPASPSRPSAPQSTAPQQQIGSLRGGQYNSNYSRPNYLSEMAVRSLMSGLQEARERFYGAPATYSPQLESAYTNALSHSLLGQRNEGSLGQHFEFNPVESPMETNFRQQELDLARERLERSAPKNPLEAYNSPLGLSILDQKLGANGSLIGKMQAQGIGLGPNGQIDPSGLQAYTMAKHPEFAGYAGDDFTVDQMANLYNAAKQRIGNNPGSLAELKNYVSQLLNSRFTPDQIQSSTQPGLLGRMFASPDSGAALNRRFAQEMGVIPNGQ